MKSLLTLIAFIVMTQVQANTTDLKAGDIGISPAHAKIISVSPVCPQNELPRCLAFGSKVKIKVSMKGCLDRFGGHVAKFEHDTDYPDYSKGILHFTALNIANRGSLAAICEKVPTKIVEVYVPHIGRLELRPLELNSKSGLNTFADLEKGDKTINEASAKIISFKPVCPVTPGGITCAAIGAHVKLKVTLNGCMDKLGGVLSKVSYGPDFAQGTLSVSALNIVNESSSVTRCAVAPTEYINLYVPMNGNADFEKLDFKGTQLTR